MTPTVWTEDRIEKLRELYGLPINQEEIARRLSDATYTFSLMAVNAQIQKLQLKRTPEVFAQMKKVAGGNKTAHHGWTETRTEELRLLVAQGLSGTQIAEKMDLSRNQVIGRSHRMGFKLSGGAAQEARKLANVSIRPARVRERKPPPLKLVEGAVKTSKPAVDGARTLSREYDGKTVRFMDTDGPTCRYIVDANATADAQTCCAPGWPYCPTHRLLCYQPAQPRRADRQSPPMGATWRASK